MKVLTAYVVSFCCYWLGHGISRVMDNAVLYRLYPIYNRLMIWSGDVEEWAGIEFMWSEPVKAGGTSSDD
jgi:hypothetical protein